MSIKLTGRQLPSTLMSPASSLPLSSSASVSVSNSKSPSSLFSSSSVPEELSSVSLSSVSSFASKLPEPSLRRLAESERFELNGKRRRFVVRQQPSRLSLYHCCLIPSSLRFGRKSRCGHGQSRGDASRAILGNSFAETDLDFPPCKRGLCEAAAQENTPLFICPVKQSHFHAINGRS